MSMGRFSRKLLIIISVSICVLIALGGVVFYVHIYNSITYDAKRNLRELTELTSANLDQHLSEMDRIAIYLAANLTLNQTFQELNATPTEAHQRRQALYSEAASELMVFSVPTSTQQFRIALYGLNGDFVSAGNRLSGALSGTRFHPNQYQEWKESLPIQHRRMSLLPPDRDPFSYNDSEVFFTVFREMIHIPSYRSTGLVAIQSPFSELERMLTFSSYVGITSRLYDANGILIFPADEYISNDTSRISSRSDLYHGNWTLELSQSQSYVNNLLSSAAIMLVMVCISMALLSLLFMYLVLKRITKPLRQLNNAVRQVDIDNLSMNIDYVRTNDEIHNLTQAFNTMLENLQKSINDFSNLKEQELRAHIIALQAQMDPHFLFNTLSIISAASRESNSDVISDICRIMADMLRYISSYDEETVPLALEVEHVEKYLSLMKYRYEEQLTYEIDLPLDDTSLRIPKLCLQPLVENCFHHGFKNTLPPWQLKITGFWDRETWRITITDNGSGFKEDALEKAIERADAFATQPALDIKTFKIGGMGLVNILSRFKLLYGDEMIFGVSRDNHQTTVTIGGKRL